MINCILRLGSFTTIVRLSKFQNRIAMINPVQGFVSVEYNLDSENPANVERDLKQVLEFVAVEQLNHDTFLYEYRGR